MLLHHIQQWAILFKLGRESVEDDRHSGLQVTAITEENIAIVEAEVLSDRRMKSKEIDARLGLSKITVLSQVGYSYLFPDMEPDTGAGALYKNGLKYLITMQF